MASSFGVFQIYNLLFLKKTSTPTDFSLDNALYHLKNISQKTHHVGTKEHKNVQQYIVGELEKLGLETEVQIQTAVNRKWFAATTAENIIAKIKGTSYWKIFVAVNTLRFQPTFFFRCQ